MISVKCVLVLLLLSMYESCLFFWGDEVASAVVWRHLTFDSILFQLTSNSTTYAHGKKHQKNENMLHLHSWADELSRHGQRMHFREAIVSLLKLTAAATFNCSETLILNSCHCVTDIVTLACESWSNTLRNLIWRPLVARHLELTTASWRNGRLCSWGS